MRACAIMTVLFAASAAASVDEKKPDEKKPAIKELSTKDLKITITIPDKSDVTKPFEAKTPGDLAKVSVLTPDAVMALGKQVDFTNDKVVVFWWGGSGQDKIAAGELKTVELKPAGGPFPERKTTATFTYTPGKTRDLRAHFHLFVVPRDAEVKVEEAKVK